MLKSTGLVLLFLIPVLTFGQNYKKIEKTADSYFKAQAYKAAIPLYESLIAIEPANPEVNFKIGLSYLETKNRESALRHLIKSYRFNPTLHPDMEYYMGRVYQLNYEFEEARTHYSNYLISGDNLELKDRIKKLIKECDDAEVLYDNPVRAKITNMGSNINTEFDEYSPIVSPDETMMVFTSRRSNSTGGRKTLDGDFYEDIYQTFFVNGAWTVPKNIGKPINTPNHDAAVSMSDEGRLIFIYYDLGGGDIYFSEYKDQEWSAPYPLNRKINTGNYETHASLSSDGKLLYFTSDRPGGYGGLDIYVSKLNEKNDWSEPVNMGPYINTAGDEDAPFIHPDGITLYFSSNGQPGLGGFDIYRSDYEDGKWSAPVNLGYPINTTDDDIYFTISADNQHGYYASTAIDGFGGKDLYVISMPKEEEIKKSAALVSASQLKIKEIKPIIRGEVVEVTNPITILKGKVIDAYSEEPLVAKLILKRDDGSIIEDQESDDDGSYIFSVPSGVQYLLEVEKEEYIFLAQGFDIPYSNKFQEIDQNVELFKVSIGSSIVLENIFFDTGKSSIRSESEEELNRLRDILKEVKNIRIRITGHTDNTGDKVFNKTLSQKRADKVKEYLIGEGIDPSRLESEGFGMEKPIASNNTVEGRQMNRRTEFEIIEN